MPYNYADSFRVLGVTLDERLGFEKHVSGVIGRTMTRHGAMAQLARTSWGLEVGLLRSAHKALITSIAQYGLTLVGNFAYEGSLNRLETQSANVAARRITGVSRAARLAVLRSTADVLSIRNEYVQQCASMLDRALRAFGSSMRERIAAELADRYGVRDWRTSSQSLRGGHLPSENWREGVRRVRGDGNIGDTDTCNAPGYPRGPANPEHLLHKSGGAMRAPGVQEGDIRSHSGGWMGERRGCGVNDCWMETGLCTGS